LLFVTLPDGSYSNGLLVLIAISITLAAIVCIVLLRALQTTSGVPVIAAVLLLGVIALLMSFQRHIVRENLLREPQLVAEQRTNEYRLALASFMETYTPEGTIAATGETLFGKYCTSCHAPDRRLVGPPTSYMVEKYKDDRDAMIQFVLNPTKIDPGYPAMPKPPAGKGEVEKIVDYILTGEETPSEEETPSGDEAPSGEEVPSGEETSSGKEALTGEGTPSGEEAPNGAEAPNGDEKPSENE
jgi:cytochrome c